MQKQMILRILVLVIGLLGSSVKSQSLETSQPIENLLTRATIKKIPVGRPDPRAHHVLMELPIVKVDLVEDEEIGVTESSPYITEKETERPNPYASSGIFSTQKRQQRFKSLRPSYPFAKRRGNGEELSSEVSTSTTEKPSTTTSEQGLRGGSLRSRFRFRPSLLSSKRKNGKEEKSVTSTPITTNEPSLVESTTQASQNAEVPFRRIGGVNNFIRRNRPSFRRKNTTNAPITTLQPSSTVSTTLAPETPRTTLAPTTVWITTESGNVKDKGLFDFDTPLDSFTPSGVRDRTGIPFTTTTKATTFNVPKIQSTTIAPAKTSPKSQLKRRRRPRPSANIVPVSQEKEKTLHESSSKNVHSKPKHLSGGKRIKGQRIKGKRRRRPSTSRTTTTGEVSETTTIEVPVTQAPSRKIRRERIITSRRNNARSDFEPLLFEEQPRRSKIITQSSIQTERKIKVPLDEENSSVFRRDNKIHLKTRRNRIRSNEIERYSFEEEDGSFTWGYKTKDGSFKEETRGADCITRGRYGYIDDSGEIREYKYESGVPCKKEENSLPNLEARGSGYFDYTDNRFVLPDGRRVKVQINQKHRARG